MLALHHVLRAAGIDSVASFSEPFVVAPHYRELPGLELLTPPDRFPREPEVMVTFDSGSLARLGDLERAGQGRGRARRDRPPRLEPALRHDQRDRSRRGRERRARAPADRPARPPDDARRRGVPLRRARLRHRPVPVRVDDAGRLRARPRALVLRPPDPRALAHAVRGAPVRVPAAARRRVAARGARPRQAVRVDEGDPGRPRAATTSPSTRSKASSTCCAAPARRRSRAC